MIDKVLPSGVEWAEVRGDATAGVPLPPEQALVARASLKRRREFAAGRSCAHRALGQLGSPVDAISIGPAGEPVWPAGAVGSITHCPGYAAAAVARASTVPTIGIDAETHEPLPRRVLAAVARPEEQTQLRRLTDDHPDLHWDRVLFSAKEAVYKAWYPHARRMLGFEDATLTLGRDGTLDARLLVPGPTVDEREVHGFAGGWTAGDGLVLTAITAIR